MAQLEQDPFPARSAQVAESGLVVRALVYLEEARFLMAELEQELPTAPELEVADIHQGRELH
jgi:hypothetical protein